MAIRVKLDYLLLDRQMTLTELAEKVGMTLANLSILKTNKARAIRFSTLDALCRELNCQPGELWEWSDRSAEPESELRTVEASVDAEILRQVGVNDGELLVGDGRAFVQHGQQRLFPFLRLSAGRS